MSQAARWRERKAERQRRTVARLIALACWPGRAEMRGDPSEFARVRHNAGLVAAGKTFDVALARVYGERLVKEGTAALETWVVYLDWLHARGWTGPAAGEWMERGAQLAPDMYEMRPAEPSTWALPASANLWRDAWAEPEQRACTACSKCPDVACERCDGVGWYWGDKVGDHVTDNRYTCDECRGSGRPPCQRCKGSRFVPGKRPRMDGAALVRMGRRLLAALEGQPSECQACDGQGGFQVARAWVPSPAGAEPVTIGSTARAVSECTSCRGTGHNLAGVLPPLVPSPQQRRKAARRNRLVEEIARLRTPYDDRTDAITFFRQPAESDAEYRQRILERQRATAADDGSEQQL